MAFSQELPPDPRLGDKTSHYDRNEIVSQLEAFYNFLPHIPSSAVHCAPPGGWPAITAETLKARGIHKNSEVVDLLRHLPYIDGIHPWIAPEAFPCDYRILGGEFGRETPGWVYDVQQDGGNVRLHDGSLGGVEKWPPWVVQLTTGTDREGNCYMLDTTDGTVTHYCVVGYLYEPTYDKDDPRAWRDRICGADTATLTDRINGWRRDFREMRLLGVPDGGDGNGYPSLHFRDDQDGPGSHGWDETEELRTIYQEYGWPDHYNKEASHEALKPWSLAH